MSKHHEKEHEVVVILPPTFSMLQLLRESFRELKEHSRFWIRLSALPFFLLLLGYGLLCYGRTDACLSMAFWSLNTYCPHSCPQTDVSVLTLLDRIGRPLLVGLAGLFSWSMIAVTGSRFLLRDERWASITFAWGHAYRKVFFYTFLFLLALGGVMTSLGLLWLMSGMLAAAGTFNPGVLFIFVPSGIACWAFVSFYLLGRTVLYSQAIALEYQDPLRVSWKLTQGHVWQVIGSYLLTILIICCVWGMMTLLLTFSGLWERMSMWTQQLFLMTLGAGAHVFKMIFLTIYFSKIFKVLEPLRQISTSATE